MALRAYRRKRDFARTPEPRGGARRTRLRAGPRFVVQRHAARSLHYDFRLEHGGVLWSWAVPKGPSADPRVKRLAVRVEDHPLEYGGFEGVIPEGEYGAGVVRVWDSGTWQPEGDPELGLAAGRLTFALAGERLRGRWHLVRTRARRHGAARGREMWLLFKGSDDDASDPPRRTRVTRAKRKSVGRDPLPRFVAPELATLVTDPPAGDEWLHELKYDGYRIQARLQDGQAKLLSRRGHDWSRRFQSLAGALQALPVRQALFDGEVVVLRDGLSDFQMLQNTLSSGDDSRCVYFVFDLLHLDGRDLRSLPLVERKALLREALRGSGERVRQATHFAGDGEAFFRDACRSGAEGSVCKLANAPYRSGRGRDWLKVKCTARQEFVVAGFTAPSGSRSHFGALLLGQHDAAGKLRYAGKVGTGFSERSLAELHERLHALETRESALADPPRGAEARGVHWVRPQLVAEVDLVERTRAGRVRHASFRGLREDKPARAVTKETAKAMPRARAPKRPNETQRLTPRLALTHPERVLYPDDGITKRELALYYAEVAPFMLPHVADRPLSLVRSPEGIGAERFFQKHPMRGSPAAIHVVPIRESKGVRDYMTVSDAQGLVSLVQIGTTEIHAWGSRAPDVERPDLLTFDLDPDAGVAWERTVAAARELRAALGELGLESFAKTTGGKGVHVVAPLAPGASWQDVREFSRALVESLVRAKPDEYLAKASKAARRGKIFLDWLRNARGATAVCPFSTRARAGAPVATPVSWSELTARLDPARFTLRTVPRRLARLTRDPWEGWAKLSQTLPSLR